MKTKSVLYLKFDFIDDVEGEKEWSWFWKYGGGKCSIMASYDRMSSK